MTQLYLSGYYAHRMSIVKRKMRINEKHETKTFTGSEHIPEFGKRQRTMAASAGDDRTAPAEVEGAGLPFDSERPFVPLGRHHRHREGGQNKAAADTSDHVEEKPEGGRVMNPKKPSTGPPRKGEAHPPAKKGAQNTENEDQAERKPGHGVLQPWWGQQIQVVVLAEFCRTAGDRVVRIHGQDIRN